MKSDTRKVRVTCPRGESETQIDNLWESADTREKKKKERKQGYTDLPGPCE
jgi:hypothetical protein